MDRKFISFSAVFGIILISVFVFSGCFGSRDFDDFQQNEGLINQNENEVFVDEKVKRGVREEIVEDEIDYSDEAQEEKFDPLKNFSKDQILKKVMLNVPFSSQAPFANWNPPYDEACEEASLIMVHFYYEKEKLNKEIADREIKKLIEWENKNGYEIDIDVADLLQVAKDFYGRDGIVYYDDLVTVENMKWILSNGYPIIIPAAGRMLGNPNFSGEGPPYHMLVLRGFDDKYFYTNDPGTRRGEEYRYQYDVILDSIHDWNGSVQTIRSGRKAILVLK